VKSRAVDHAVDAGMLLGSKENCCCKNSLETFDDAPIVAAIFRQVEEVEHLRCGLEARDTALLADGKRRNPNGYEPVLAVWQPEIGMRDDVKKEFAVAPTMDLLCGRGTPERKPAQNKGSGVERKRLTAILPLLAHKTD